MSHRSTSVTTYHSIKSSGLLSERRFEVYEILYNHGPLTAHEVVEIARSKHPLANQTGFNARLSELEEMGVVERVGKKIHTVSNQENYLWDTTAAMPKPLVKKKSKDEIIRELTEENVRLRRLARVLKVKAGYA